LRFYSSGSAEEFYLLGYNAVQSVESQALLVICFHTGFLLGLFFDPEDEGDIFFRNIC
jgi:hypothetical protein